MNDRIRFLSFVRHGLKGCWEWAGWHNPLGYSMFSVKGHNVAAHRFSHENWVGPIPDGYDIDHLCRNPGCVNPAHLEAVTHRENLLRGNTFAARRAAQTHCVNGHEFTPENTRIRSNGTRACRSCHRYEERRRRAQRRTA